MCYQRTERKQTGSGELHHGTRYQKKDISTEDPIPSHIYVVSMLILLKIYYGRFMKGYEMAIPGEDLWHIVP